MENVPIEYKSDKLDKEASCFTFQADSDKWIMKIEDGVFKFNREQYPNCAPDAFAEAVLKILERSKIIASFELPPPEIGENGSRNWRNKMKEDSGWKLF